MVPGVPVLVWASPGPQGHGGQREERQELVKRRIAAE